MLYSDIVREEGLFLWEIKEEDSEERRIILFIREYIWRLEIIMFVFIIIIVGVNYEGEV